MEGLDRLKTLCEHDRMAWSDEMGGWIAEPDEVVNALSDDGFAESPTHAQR
jgi:hypothetical protein